MRYKQYDSLLIDEEFGELTFHHGTVIFIIIEVIVIQIIIVLMVMFLVEFDSFVLCLEDWLFSNISYVVLSFALTEFRIFFLF